VSTGETPGKAIDFRSGRWTLADDSIGLPKGAWARTHRRTLRCDGRPVLALTQGRHRAYVYPLWTPGGHVVTSEAPADHPHHNSFWIAADHVHCKMPVAHGGFEDYTYNFYLDETFQGRAAGQIVETGLTASAIHDSTLRIEQTLDWRGPSEWAAPAGRVAARETRTLTVRARDTMHVIDVESRLASADWAFGDCTATPFPGAPSDTKICVRGGFDKSRIYRLVYRVKDPLVLGLGLAAFRDAAAFFRYARQDDFGTANPVANGIKWTVVQGTSQSGNFIKTMIHLGFTEDDAVAHRPI